MGFVSGLLRRLIGGWLSTKEIISERGIQWIIGLIIYGITISIKINWFGAFNTWLFELLPLLLFVILGSLSIILCLTSGHFPGFMCGTESQKYINEQITKGREIKFKKIVDWIGIKRGFQPLDKEWCFWQLLLCKTTACILPAFFFGPQIILIGVVVAMAYNAMFWVQMKSYKDILTSPTNWGEFWQGYFIVWGILCC